MKATPEKKKKRVSLDSDFDAEEKREKPEKRASLDSDFDDAPPKGQRGIPLIFSPDLRVLMIRYSPHVFKVSPELPPTRSIQ